MSDDSDIEQVFRGANVKNRHRPVRKLATSHCTIRISTTQVVEIWCVVIRTHTGSCTVTACRTAAMESKM